MNSNPLIYFVSTCKKYIKFIIILFILWSILTSIIIYRDISLPKTYVGEVRIYANDYEYEIINKLIRSLYIQEINDESDSDVSQITKEVTIELPNKLDPIYALNNLFVQINNPDINKSSSSVFICRTYS